MKDIVLPTKLCQPFFSFSNSSRIIWNQLSDNIIQFFNQRKEALSLYEQQGREDLAQKEKEEMSILESFLPKQLSDDELTGILKGIIEQVGAKAPSDMGKVMGIASKSLAGKAEGGRISAKVKELLNS